MNNFTEPYIREADCEAIQGFRKTGYDFRFGDWHLIRGVIGEPCVATARDLIHMEDNREKYIWLPTGDQLDEEIAKICKKKELWRYEFAIENHFNWDCSVTFLRREKAPLGMGAVIDKTFTASNSNPLIAKICLLKQLIKESEE